ncbi:MAG: 5-oxoprolinase subunit PxpA [Rhodospirillales bacterium]|nr:5-oxoprolinase subunit PxpA [Rhodospirillales bacterium]MDE2200152.1 5-oxoprolinase subunit PxpA [Rhodospirillales bacterium]MDE2574439.1 5-oxoprolinase subunit PxpA [Rhodospirillales bacterium]
MDIDLNADLAEGYGAWRIGDDAALLDIVSSANIACGFHAGDPPIMDRTIRLAAARGVDIGAHVGFPDRQGFGRRVMQIDTAELATMVIYQLGALAGIARAAGQAMTHMSFHGALGNLAAGDPALALPLLRAVASFDPALTVISSTSKAIEEAAAATGLRVVTTFLADRAYDDEGLLVPRKVANSVIHDPALVLERVRRMLNDGHVITWSGKPLAMRPRSILLHGDTSGSVDLARRIRGEIEQGGGRVVPVSRQAA